MTGQDAVTVAESFDATLALDGVILTKLDGDARGGAALSVKEVVGKPIAFASTGEKVDDALDLFHPDRLASRILGMGDVLTLIEKAEQVYEKEGPRRRRPSCSRDASPSTTSSSSSSRSRRWAPPEPHGDDARHAQGAAQRRDRRGPAQAGSRRSSAR